MGERTANVKRDRRAVLAASALLVGALLLGCGLPSRALQAVRPAPTPTFTARPAPTVRPTNTPAATPTLRSATATPSPARPADPCAQVRAVTIREQTADYDVNVTYPVFGRPKLDAPIAAAMKKEVETHKDVAVEDRKVNKDMAKAPPYNLDRSFTCFAFSDTVLSIEYKFSDYTGGAHGGSAVYADTYDLKAERKLTLSDVFVSGSSYLQRLSAFSVAELTRTLKDQSDSHWIQSGAAPDAKNFPSFGLTRDELVLYFGTYQVAPGAAGPQQVRLPLKQLAAEGLLRPEFVR